MSQSTNVMAPWCPAEPTRKRRAVGRERARGSVGCPTVAAVGTARQRGEPFHTEVGYWLWDSATGEVLRGFVVPRVITVLAGGVAAADAKSFTLSARPGDANYSIGEN